MDSWPSAVPNIHRNNVFVKRQLKILETSSAMRILPIKINPQISVCNKASLRWLRSLWSGTTWMQSKTAVRGALHPAATGGTWGNLTNPPIRPSTSIAELLPPVILLYLQRQSQRSRRLSRTWSEWKVKEAGALDSLTKASRSPTQKKKAKQNSSVLRFLRFPLTACQVTRPIALTSRRTSLCRRWCPA